MSVGAATPCPSFLDTHVGSADIIETGVYRKYRAIGHLAGKL
jgi:hypothetical protein